MMRHEVPSAEDCRSEMKEFEVPIEQGMRTFDEVQFKHMASQMPGHSPGNVNFKFKLRKHDRFQISGNNLMMPVEISVYESLVGWERQIKHLDGHILHVSSSDVTKPGQAVTIEGEGMPVKDAPTEAGNLILKITVVYPKKITGNDRASLAGLVSLNSLANQRSRSEL